MDKSVEKAAADKSKISVWDCGSTLYDSFELNTFKRQLDSALVCTSLSMPHLNDHTRGAPPPQSQTNIVAAKKQSKIYRFGKLIRSVFRTRSNNSATGSLFRLLQDGSNKDGSFYVVYDTSGALTTIPEAPEIDFGGLSPEISSMVRRRRTSSERFTATSLGISCA